MLQTRWRSKRAKKELRRRRQEARESGKLLQDKQALEVRLREMQAILETVQNQRNELKQLYKACPPSWNSMDFYLLPTFREIVLTVSEVLLLYSQR